MEPMKTEKGGVKNPIAKGAPQTARVAKPSRIVQLAAPVAAPPKQLASADLSHSLIYHIRRAQLLVFKDVTGGSLSLRSARRNCSCCL